MKYIKLSFLCVVAFTLVFIPKANSEAPWLTLTDGNKLSVELSISNYDSHIKNIGFGSSAWFFGYQHYFNNRLALVAELPFGLYFPEDDTNTDNETSIGNILIGLKINDLGVKSNKLIGEFGLRLPIAPDDEHKALALNGYSNFSRFEAFLNDFWTLSFKGTYQKSLTDVSDILFSAGGDFLINTDSDNDSEAFLDLSIFYKTHFNDFMFGAGFLEKILMTDDSDFSNRAIEQIGAAAVYDNGKWKPGVSLRIPIEDDIGDIINFNVGFNLIYSLD